MRLPPLMPVRQRLPGRPLADVAAAARDEMSRAGITRGLKPGACIGVAVGSRGIPQLAAIISTVVAELRAAGARPVIIPAMGSHGGATAAGQRELLAGFGITPRSVGAPVRASMAAERLGETAAGVPIWFSREALRCGGVVVVNRVKAHSDFRGPFESGLMKMIGIGLGKHRGAITLHSLRVPGLRDQMPEVAREMIRRGHILGGIALIESGCGEIVRIAAMPARDIESTERRLLRAANRLAPRLPFDEIDALIVDWMGKDISGVGLDPNLLGRTLQPGERAEPPRPRLRNVVALRLTPASHGNALGVGLADFIPRSLADSIDWRVLKANVMTSGFIQRAKLPLVMDSERAAIAAAIAVGHSRPLHARRVVRIRDTAHLGEMWISPALADDARRLGLEVLGPARALRFDRRGRLADVMPRG
jgi:hypothetical protein